MKKSAVAILSTLLMIFLALPVFASNEEIRVYVDGNRVNFPDQKPIINSDNRTLVPVRFVSQALGANVEWIEAHKRVEINQQGKIIKLTVGQKKAQVGEETVTLDTKADIINSRTMVPLRFVSECLGAEVVWNNKAKEIIITTAGQVTEFAGQSFKPSDLPLASGTVIWGSDRPTARIMWAKMKDLPIKYGDDIIYDIKADNEYIYIKQYSHTQAPVGLFMVIDGKLGRSRAYTSEYQDTTVFTYKNPVNLSTEKALGMKPVDIMKVSHFAFDTMKHGAFVMLVVENPAYEGGK